MGSLDALSRTYLDHLGVERGVSAHTLSAYRRDLARYVHYLGSRGVTDPDEVTAAVVADFSVRLREGEHDEAGALLRPPLAPASIARAVVAIRSMHRFALAEGLTVDDPARDVQPPKPSHRLPKAITVAQVQAILDVPARDTELGLRDLALLELLYGTGVRITEAVNLDVDDVTRAVGISCGSAPPRVGGDPPCLRVLGKGNKERVVPVGSYAKAALEAYLVRARPVLSQRGKASPAMFLNAHGGRLSRQSAWSILQATARKAAIGIDISPHTLRHSFATHLLDGGADVRVVQELLGHASVTTTQIYTLVTVDHLREVYATSHPRAY